MCYKEAIKRQGEGSLILSHSTAGRTSGYKHELDPEGIPQFGLVAEQVEKVDPDLVARDEQGKAYTVRYEAVNAMLLNEFIKEHRGVEALAADSPQVAQLQSALKQQASQIQKVSDQLEMARPALRMVASALKKLSNLGQDRKGKAMHPNTKKQLL